LAGTSTPWLGTGPFPPKMRMGLTCSVVLPCRDRRMRLLGAKSSSWGRSEVLPGDGILRGGPLGSLQPPSGWGKGPVWGQAPKILRNQTVRGQKRPGSCSLLETQEKLALPKAFGWIWGGFSPFWRTHRVSATATARRLPAPRSRPIQLPAAPSTTEDLQRDRYWERGRKQHFCGLHLAFNSFFFRSRQVPRVAPLSDKALQASVGAAEVRTHKLPRLLDHSEQSLGAWLFSSLCCTQGCPGEGKDPKQRPRDA